MIGIVVAVAAATGAPPVQHVGYTENDQRRLATIAPYPPGRADDVRRPGFNGRLWIGESIVGPTTHHWPLGWGDPGPNAYGALDQEFSTVFARIDHLVVAVSPWIQFHQSGMADFEAARAEWLKERGFVGGVRTFVNDAHLGQWLPAHSARPLADDQLLTAATEALESAGPVAKGKLPEPRATITLPDDMVKIKSRQRVQNDKPARVIEPGVKLAASPDAGRQGKSTVKFAVVAPDHKTAAAERTTNAGTQEKSAPAARKAPAVIKVAARGSETSPK